MGVLLERRGDGRSSWKVNVSKKRDVMDGEAYWLTGHVNVCAFLIDLEWSSMNRFYDKNVLVALILFCMCLIFFLLMFSLTELRADFHSGWPLSGPCWYRVKSSWRCPETLVGSTGWFHFLQSKPRPSRHFKKNKRETCVHSPCWVDFQSFLFYFHACWRTSN